MSPMRPHRAALTAIALTAVATAAPAQSYRCAPWDSAAPGIADIAAITVGTSLATVRDGGPVTTVRMAHGSLTRRASLDDTSALAIYGDFPRGADGPEFGPEISVQRLYDDPDRPTLLKTTCEATP